MSDFTPYPSQLDDLAYLRANDYTGLLAIQVGGGKTAVACMVVEDLDPDVVLVIAPQSTFRDPERNWPSSMRLICDRDVLPLGSGTKRERENLTAFELGVRGVYACTPQFFTRADVSLWSGDLAIVDECFVAGTTVETPLGPRNIEDLRAGDEVWGFDHTTGRVTLTHVRGTMEKVATNVTPSGATVNHPYYVPGAGYLPLGDLTREDRVLAFDRESVSGVREVVFPGFDSPQPGVLLPPLCGQEARNRLNSNGGAGVSGVRSSIYCQALGEETNLLGGVCRSTTSAKSALGAGRTHLRGVRGHVSGTTKRGEEDVFPGVPVSPTKCDNERKPGSTRGKAPKTFVRKNDPEQSNVDARSEREGSGLLSRSRLFAPQGGQWSRVTNRVSTLATVARGVASGYHRYYRRVGSSRPVPQSLQVGHGNTGTSLGRGGGRAEPQFLGAPGTGRAKGASPYSDGVDHLAVQKPRSTERYSRVSRRYIGGSEQTVYNLETGTSNYFANGVLVHNCHQLATPQSKGQRKLSGYSVKDAEPLSRRFAHRLSLSGTPMRQNFSNMWSIMRFLWPDLDQRGEVAYSNFVAWQVNRMDSHYVWTNRKDRWGEPIKVRQFDRESEPGRLVSEMPCVVIHKRREACCKHHPKGFLSVKAPKEIKHIIDLHPKQLKAIHEMEDHMMTWLDDNPLVADIPLVAKVRIRQMCLGVPTVTWTEGEETAKVTFDIDCESPTLDKLLELAEELDEGEPLVVYTDSQKFAEVTVERLNKAGYVAKEYSGVRKAQLSRFGEDYQVLVGVTSSIGTGTDGLNRVCQTEVWLEPPLSVTMETQTAARLDRIGTPRQVERHYILDSTKYLEGRLNDLIEKRIMSNNSLRKAVA